MTDLGFFRDGDSLLLESGSPVHGQGVSKAQITARRDSGFMHYSFTGDVTRGTAHNPDGTVRSDGYCGETGAYYEFFFGGRRCTFTFGAPFGPNGIFECAVDGVERIYKRIGG